MERGSKFPPGYSGVLPAAGSGKNGPVSEAADFIDASLQREGAWYRAEAAQASLAGEVQGMDLHFYGASVGAVRGTVRDALRRHPGLPHDDVAALSSELWSVPVFERRLAGVVLLQSSLPLLGNSDLTRIEGFIRQGRIRALVDPLAIDVTGPLVEGLSGAAKGRANGILDRWARDPDAWLRRAAVLSPLRGLRAGADGWDGFVRRARAALAEPSEHGGDGGVVREAVSRVLEEMARKSPELRISGVDQGGRE